MKNKVVLLVIMSLFALTNVVAQEYDDMYFNKKDRAKLAASKKTSSVSYSDVKKNRTEEDTYDVNPTDSYSARNVNPEFTSRSKSQTAQADNEDYFLNNYRYNNSYSNFNNNFNNWYNNPWYTSAYWGPGIYRWNSPYYGYYDSWGSPWSNPYYNSGWSNSFYYGSSWSSGWGWNSGFGMSYGWGSPWSSFGMCPYWGSASYAYSPYAGWYRTPTVVVVDQNSRGAVYGKRTSRSSSIVENRANQTTGRTYANTGSNSRSDRGGRISTSSTRESDYYQPTWRNQSRSSGSTSTSNSGRTSTWDNNSRSTYRESTPSYSSPSRNTSSGSTGSRSSSGSSSGSSGSRSSRGRGN